MLKIRDCLAAIGLYAIASCNNANAPVPVGLPSAATKGAAGTLMPAARYAIVDLGANVAPVRINSRDAVVGSLNNSAFLYQNGELANLGVYPGDTVSSADDVNDAGEIVGQSSNTPAQAHAVVFHPGATPTLLYTPTAQNPYANASAVNSNGEVAGWIGGANACGFYSVVFSDSGEAKKLSAGEFAVSIDNEGSVVGHSYSVGGGGCHGESTTYEYHPTRTLPFPKNEAGVWGVIPTGLSNDGTIVGWYDYCNVRGPGCNIGGFFRCGFRSVASCGYAGYVYHGRRMTVVYSPFPKDSCLVLNGINRHEEMVGAICRAAKKNPAPHAIRVVGTRVTDLNSLISPNSSWVLHNATAVNGSGVIVGTGSYHGAAHGFMLIPSV